MRGGANGLGIVQHAEVKLLELVLGAVLGHCLGHEKEPRLYFKGSLFQGIDYSLHPLTFPMLKHSSFSDWPSWIKCHDLPLLEPTKEPMLTL